MTFMEFTLKNLLRRPLRTGLTVMGIGLGIGAVVALLGLAWGLEKSWSDGLRARQTDLVIRKASGGLLAQTFDESARTKVLGTEGVAASAGLLGEVLSVEEVPLLVVSGREWGSFVWESLEVIEGRLPASAEENAVVAGKIAAETLGKRAGETVNIEGEEFTVAGIVDGKAMVENGSLIMSLPLLQKLMDKKGQVNFINIRLKPGVRDMETVAKNIERQLPGLRAEIAADVFGKSDAIRTLKAMNWGTSAIALLIGTFGVMNTMFMSIFERSREIAIIIALGWKRSGILRMVLWEAIGLCAVAGVVGVLLGAGLLKVLALTPWIHGKLEPYIGWDLSLMAFAFALIIGVVSGLYPALHCTKINPSLAIRENY